jgi:uncharacterized protein
MSPAQGYIGFGHVAHERLSPKRHAFKHASFFLWLPMRALSERGVKALAVNRFAPLSFYDQDHGDARGAEGGGALAWFEELMREQGIEDVEGEVWLHCYPRVWGYAFKPVSFWYGHARSGELRVILAEVNNTFGERHFYLLKSPSYGQTLSAQKVFHVSPFCEVSGHYEFRFMTSPPPAEWPTLGVSAEGMRAKTVARIEYHDDQGCLLKTRVSGELEPLSSASARRALWRYPMMTLGVIFLIHWHALRLWLKRVSFFSKPAPPLSGVSHSSSPP